MMPFIDTRDNLFYTKMRDTLEAQQARFTKVKNRQIEAQNEKMFGRLIKILNTESEAVGKTRNGLGPQSMNVVARRQRIRQINTDNEKLS